MITVCVMKIHSISNLFWWLICQDKRLDDVKLVRISDSSFGAVKGTIQVFVGPTVFVSHNL